MKRLYLLLPMILVLVLVGCGKKKEAKEDPNEVIRKKLIEDKTYQLGSDTVGSGYGYTYVFFEDGTYYYFNTEYGYTTEIDTPCDFSYGKWKIVDQKLALSDIKVMCYKDTKWTREGEVIYPTGTVISEIRPDMDYTISLKSNGVEISGDVWYKVSVRVDDKSKISKMISEGKEMPHVDDLVVE